MTDLLSASRLAPPTSTERDCSAMSVPPPHGGYPAQAQAADSYATGGAPNDQRQQHPGHDEASPQDASNPGQPWAHAAAAGAGGKKKRAYAGQAFDYGSGANAALGGQNSGLANYAGSPNGPWEGGYPQQMQQPAYGVEQPSRLTSGPMYPQQLQQPGAMGAYQPSDQGYPTSAVPQGTGGVASMTTQFGQMNVGGQQPPLVQHISQQRTQPLNQLYPTDLASQPFHVSELDLPPPPIILPQNVSVDEGPDIVVVGYSLVTKS